MTRDPSVSSPDTVGGVPHVRATPRGMASAAQAACLAAASGNRVSPWLSWRATAPDRHCPRWPGVLPAPASPARVAFLSGLGRWVRVSHLLLTGSIRLEPSRNIGMSSAHRAHPHSH